MGLGKDPEKYILLSEKQKQIGELVLKEIHLRLKFLINVGLDYLTLDRPAMTLSGGEAQRIRLATQIGAGLTGVLYVLDEPSIGLHQRDNDRLLDTLKSLRDLQQYFSSCWTWWRYNEICWLFSRHRTGEEYMVVIVAQGTFDDVLKARNL